MDASAKTAAPAWPAQPLTQFIAAVSAAQTETVAARAAVEHAAEVLDADVAAIVADAELVTATGWPEGSVPVAEIAAVRPGAAGTRLPVPGAGSCPAAAAALDYPPGGTLVLARSGPRGWSREETALLRGMARVAATTMRMLRVLAGERAARQEAGRLAGEQAALRRVATLVAKAASPEEVFAAVGEEVAQLSEADVSMVLRYEPDGTATVVGGWGDRGQDLSVGSRLRVEGEGVAVFILHTGQPARTVRVTGPPGSIADAFHRAGVQVASGSPIVVEGRLWGAVIAARTAPEPLPAAAEQRIPAFTELVATAIANAQAREELSAIAGEQAALRRVATLIARGAPPAGVFAAVAEEVGQVLPAAAFTMVTRYDPGDVAEVVGEWSRTGDIPIRGDRAPLGGQNVTTLVFQTGRPARIDGYEDASGVQAENARALGLGSAVGAPISVEGRVWGAVIVASMRGGALPPGTEERLAGFTELAATAIGNAQARSDLRGYADEQAALRRVATLVARGAPPDEVFAAVTEEAGRLLEADFTAMGRFGVDREAPIVVLGVWESTGAAPPLSAGQELGFGDVTLPRLVFETGRPARIGGPGADLPMAPARASGVRSAVGAPISVQGRLWGVMLVGLTRDESFPAGTEARLARFTELIATAIANAEAQAALTASRARVVATADETRRRIERDLHDGAQQRLVALGLQLRAAQAAVPPGLSQVRAELDQVVAGLNSTLDELREYARGIHPAILAERGLGPALRTLARRSLVPVELELRTTGRLPERIEVTAYYVVSEALTNAAKHASASAVRITVEVAAGVLSVMVCDNGAGGADPARGSGLVGLADRVEAAGGTMLVRSPPGEGTCVFAELPVSTAARPQAPPRPA